MSTKGKSRGCSSCGRQRSERERRHAAYEIGCDHDRADLIPADLVVDEAPDLGRQEPEPPGKAEVERGLSEVQGGADDHGGGRKNQLDDLAQASREQNGDEGGEADDQAPGNDIGDAEAERPAQSETKRLVLRRHVLSAGRTAASNVRARMERASAGGTASSGWGTGIVGRGQALALHPARILLPNHAYGHDGLPAPWPPCSHDLQERAPGAESTPAEVFRLYGTRRKRRPVEGHVPRAVPLHAAAALAHTTAASSGASSAGIRSTCIRAAGYAAAPVRLAPSHSAAASAAAAESVILRVSQGTASFRQQLLPRQEGGMEQPALQQAPVEQAPMLQGVQASVRLHERLQKRRVILSTHGLDQGGQIGMRQADARPLPVQHLQLALVVAVSEHVVNREVAVDRCPQIVVIELVPLVYRRDVMPAVQQCRDRTVGDQRQVVGEVGSCVLEQPFRIATVVADETVGMLADEGLSQRLLYLHEGEAARGLQGVQRATLPFRIAAGEILEQILKVATRLDLPKPEQLRQEWREEGRSACGRRPLPAVRERPAALAARD